MAGSRLLLLPEVAERLRLTEAGLRWQIHARKAPPSIVLNGRRVWDEDALDAWIASQFAQEAV